MSENARWETVEVSGYLFADTAKLVDAIGKAADEAEAKKSTGDWPRAEIADELRQYHTLASALAVAFTAAEYSDPLGETLRALEQALRAKMAEWVVNPDGINEAVVYTLANAIADGTVQTDRLVDVIPLLRAFPMDQVRIQ